MSFSPFFFLSLFLFSLAAIKKVPLHQRTKLKLFFEPTEVGEQEYKLYFMCDSYMGCDQEYEFKVKVEQGEELADSDEEDEEEDEEEAGQGEAAAAKEEPDSGEAMVTAED